MKKIDIRIIIAVMTISGTLLGIIVTHVLYRSKLRKDQKAGGEKVISEKIINSLFEVRNFELKLREIDIGDLEIFNKINPSNESLVYCSIFNSNPDLFEFQNKLGDVMREHELNLDRDSAAFLFVLQNYLSRLMVNFQSTNDEECKVLGILFYKDFRTWQQDFDAHIVKQINKNPIKLFSLKGRVWEKTKNKYTKKYLDESILMKMISETGSNVA